VLLHYFIIITIATRLDPVGPVSCQGSERQSEHVEVVSLQLQRLLHVIHRLVRRIGVRIQAIWYAIAVVSTEYV